MSPGEFFLWVMIAVIGGVPAAAIFHYRWNIARGCLAVATTLWWPLRTAWRLLRTAVNADLAERVEDLEQRNRSLTTIVSSMQNRLSAQLESSDPENNPDPQVKEKSSE